MSFSPGDAGRWCGDLDERDIGFLLEQKTRQLRKHVVRGVVTSNRAEESWENLEWWMRAAFFIVTWRREELMPSCSCDVISIFFLPWITDEQSANTCSLDEVTQTKNKPSPCLSVCLSAFHSVCLSAPLTHTPFSLPSTTCPPSLLHNSILEQHQ